MRLRRKLRRSRARHEDCATNVKEYRLLKRNLKTEIKKSKDNSWRELCNQVETDPWGTPYKLVGRRPITGITIPGRLESIVDTLFPMHQPPIWPASRPTGEVPLITAAELALIGARLPTNKAPGPDGIQDIILKRIIVKKPVLIFDTLNRCLLQGYFEK